MTEISIRETNWISLIRPSGEDLGRLHKRFPQIHPLVLEDLSTPTIRPSHVESYDNHIYVVLHFPSYLEDRQETISYEIDFILLKDAIITVQYDDIPLLDEIRKEYQENLKLHDKYGETPAHILYYILKKFFNFTLKELDQIQENMDLMEEKVFAGKHKETLESMAILRRTIIDFRRALKPQQFTFESLVSAGVQLYSGRVKPFLSDILEEYLKAWNLLESHKETLDALHGTNNSLLNARTNEIMRVFTILAFISFIPTAIANIYGMNIDDIPFADSGAAFWIILAFMAILTLMIYLVLKWKRLV